MIEGAPLSLAVVDPCCPAPYGYASLDAGGLGGTEATVLRVLAGLRGQGHCRLYQSRRTDTVRDRGLTFAPLDDAWAAVDLAPTIVVVNAWKVALRLRRFNPDARILLWLHVVPGRHNRKMGAALADAGIDVVCVSSSHAAILRKFLTGQAPRLPRIHVIHNPVDADLAPDDTPRDPDLMLFASSPHKGLAEVFERFAALRPHLPDLRLEVADPGYLRWPVPDPPEGVTLLGPLPRSQVLAKMRRAMCLFYPQTAFAETFGLVIAEANAVGTPALLQSGLGANGEVASTADQLIDARDAGAVLARLRAWRGTPPRVSLRPEFRPGPVIAAWQRLMHQAVPAVAVPSQFGD